jgi:hypothetical protein
VALQHQQKLDSPHSSQIVAEPGISPRDVSHIATGYDGVLGQVPATNTVVLNTGLLNSVVLVEQ